MSNKLNTYLLSILFVTVLILPVFNDVFGIWKFERKDENRAFKDDLEINVNKLDNFPEDCEEFVKDNFSFRYPALESFHRLKYHVFSTSPNREKTIFGRDNWYFLVGRELDEVEGKIRFNQAQLDTIKQEWRRRSTYLTSKGIKYYWVVSPYKHQVYSEYLPLNIYQSPKPARVEQLEAVLNDEFPSLLINPIDALQNVKKKHRVFAQLDNHWNYRAGEVVSNLILDRIRKDFPNETLPDLSTFQWSDEIVKEGIHYSTINIESLYEVLSQPILATSNAIERKPYGYWENENVTNYERHEIRFESKKPKTKLRILFIRDSFGNALIPFISDYFAESLFIFDDWKYNLNERIIESYKPDIVVFLNVATLADSYLSNH